MKRAFLLFLSLSILPYSLQGDETTSKTFPGLQAVYLRPEILTEEASETYMAHIKKWGAKEVFLEASFNNRVLNHSKIFPVMDPEKDWLEILVKKAKKHGVLFSLFQFKKWNQLGII